MISFSISFESDLWWFYFVSIAIIYSHAEFCMLKKKTIWYNPKRSGLFHLFSEYWLRNIQPKWHANYFIFKEWSTNKTIESIQIWWKRIYDPISLRKFIEHWKVWYIFFKWVCRSKCCDWCELILDKYVAPSIVSSNALY